MSYLNWLLWILVIHHEIQFTTKHSSTHLNLNSVVTHLIVKNTSVTYKITEAMELGNFKHTPALYFVNFPTLVE
jgi:hypothetical protein